jgi:hypothetical protein
MMTDIPKELTPSIIRITTPIELHRATFKKTATPYLLPGKPEIFNSAIYCKIQVSYAHDTDLYMNNM